MKHCRSEAPGRVNLIGEHTDYNGGFVLPIAIPQKTRVEIALREDDWVKITSSYFLGSEADYLLGNETKRGSWIDYLQGVTALLKQKGYPISGFSGQIRSDIPMGSGLSSSASLLVAIFRALRSAFALDINDVSIATLSQQVENDFVGAHVGIMDQMAASLAREDAALFLDTRDLSYRSVALPSQKVEIVVINSGVVHSHIHSGYNTRRQECEEACRLLGVSQLREITDVNKLQGLPPVIRQRARHVVTENERVLKFVEALEDVDLTALGRLMYESHASMKDDYQVSVPQIDSLVNIAAAEAGVIGARLTGGGFGGSIVVLCERGKGDSIANNICKRYASQSAGLAAERIV